jgi:8-oxo-dGTP diphosphatase
MPAWDTVARVHAVRDAGFPELARFAQRHLEEGENILQAAIRETKEETGITLDPATLRLALSIHQRGPGTSHTRIGFAFEPRHRDGEPVIGEPARCSQLVWADPASPPSGTVPYTAAIIGAIQNGATFALNGW